MLEIVLWILVVIAGVIAGLILLDQLFLWMETKGWIYYRKVKSKSGLGDIFIGSNVIDPGVRHLQEARQQRAGEEDEDDGDDERARKPEHRIS